MRLIVWGAGELGGRVAASWIAGGGEVLALTATETRHEALRAAGCQVALGSAAAHLRPDDALLLAIPGHPRQSEALDTLGDTPPPARAVLISSTGVYGQPDGPVDEQTPPGTGDRPEGIAAVEQRWRAWAGAAAVAIRCGGLYRPGRGPYASLARRRTVPAGMRVQADHAGPADKPLALIHYHDAATATLAALRHPAPEACYLAVTPPLPTRGEFYTAACQQLGLDAPQFGPDLGAVPHYDVTRLRRDLLPDPAYPDWKAALVGGNELREFHRRRSQVAESKPARRGE